MLGRTLAMQRLSRLSHACFLTAAPPNLTYEGNEPMSIYNYRDIDTLITITIQLNIYNNIQLYHYIIRSLHITIAT